MPCTDHTIRQLSDLWCEDHVFKYLDKRIKTFHGAHRLFTKIESGEVRAYAALGGDDRFLGVCFGMLAVDGVTFAGHVAFYRNSDAVHGVAACERVMVRDYAEEGVRVEYIAGYVPDYNRAALLMLRRAGYIDMGLRNEVTIVRGDYFHPCREMRKAMR